MRVRAKRSKNEHRDHGGGGPPEAALTCSKTTSPPACSVRTRQLVRARQRCSCPPANVTPKQSTHQRAFEPRQELPSASTRTEVPPTRENACCEARQRTMELKQALPQTPQTPPRQSLPHTASQRNSEAPCEASTHQRTLELQHGQPTALEYRGRHVQLGLSG